MSKSISSELEIQPISFLTTTIGLTPWRQGVFFALFCITGKMKAAKINQAQSLNEI